MLDQKFYEEENRILRDLVKSWKEMYENLYKEHEELVKQFDALAMDVIERDMKELGK